MAPSQSCRRCSIMTDLQGSNAAREVNPFGFVSAFRAAFPMFAERTENGQGYVQQDAEECWSALVSNLSQHMQLPTEGGGEAATSNLAAADGGQVLPRQKALKRNLGDMLFGLEFESAYKCLDNDSEPSYVMRDTERKIACHISEKTAHLYGARGQPRRAHRQALRAARPRGAVLEEEEDCTPAADPHGAVCAVAWRKDTGKRAKILRTVSFPPVLDVRNLCTANLQASINAHCSALEEERDAATGVWRRPPRLRARRGVAAARRRWTLRTRSRRRARRSSPSSPRAPRAPSAATTARAAMSSLPSSRIRAGLPRAGITCVGEEGREEVARLRR